MQLPSAVLTLLPNISLGTAADSPAVEPAIRFYTPGLLVLLPFPDMSMPFNVVAFTSTVLAFFFGSLFNLTYSTTADIVARSQQTPIARIKGRLAALLGKCRRQATVSAAVERDAVSESQPPGEKARKEDSKESEDLQPATETTEYPTETASDIDTSTAPISTTRMRKVPSNNDT